MTEKNSNKIDKCASLETIKIKNKINIFKKDHGESLNVGDIANMKNITIVDLLYNLKNRFEDKSIFSNLGNELIIVNPLEFNKETFSADRMNYFIEV